MNSDNIYRLLSHFVSPQPLQPKNDMPTATDTPEKQFWKVNDEETKKMRSLQMTLSYKLTTKQQSLREKVVSNMIQLGRKYLQLKDKTLQLSIRLFDLYSMRIAEGHYFQGHILRKRDKGYCIFDKKDQCQLAMLAATFSCAKYHQIYPPTLSDFLFVFHDKFTRQEVIMKEIELIQIDDFTFTITTLTDWYGYYYDEKLPSWGVDCLSKCYNISMQEIAKVIKIVETSHDWQKENDVVQKAVLIQRTMRLIPTSAKEKALIYQSDQQNKK